MSTGADSRRVVLLVEDDEQVRLGTKRYLQAKGMEPIVASDGLAAIKVLLDEEVDVIVTDYKMQVLGGDYWIRFLQKHYGDKKIIVVTGFLEPDVSLPFPVVYKPFDYDKLVAAILD
jgi:DNA-binding response OmpR family regulator